MRLRVKSEAVRSPTRGRTECGNHAATVSRLVIVAAAEAANQVSYAEGNGGGRVWALLYGCAEEVLSSNGAFANNFHGIRRRLLHLSVDILRCTFRLFCLALELTFYVTRSSSQSLFHPAADVFGITDNAIFVHERRPFLRFRISTVGVEAGFPFPARQHQRTLRCRQFIEMPSGHRVGRRRGGRPTARGAPAATERLARP